MGENDEGGVMRGGVGAGDVEGGMGVSVVGGWEVEKTKGGAGGGGEHRHVKVGLEAPASDVGARRAERAPTQQSVHVRDPLREGARNVLQRLLELALA